MRKFSTCAFAMVAALGMTASAMAATGHHHGKHSMHTKGKMAQKSDEGSASTADLNAKSLSQAQSSMAPTTAPAAAPMPASTMPSGSTMPMNAPMSAPSTMPANAPNPQ